MKTLTPEQRAAEVIRMKGITGEVTPRKLYQDKLTYQTGKALYTVKLSPLEKTYIERGKK